MRPSLKAGPKPPKAGDNQIQAVTDPSSSSGHSETAEEETATKDEILEVDYFRGLAAAAQVARHTD